MDHRLACKVYYEDTDCVGVVYYANYLKYLERGRSELLADLGCPVEDWQREGLAFVVHSVTVRYRRPAVLGDVLEVVTRPQLRSRFRITFDQRVERGSELIVTASVDVACIDAGRSVVAVPERLVELIGAGTADR